MGLPLRFIVSSLVAFVAGVAALGARPEILTTYHYNQWVLAITHVFTLGWLAAVIMGAMYQLVPVALETRLYSPRLGYVQFWVHLAAWPGLVVAFWHGHAGAAALFGTSAALSISLFIYNMARTLRRVPAWSVVALGITSALLWLAMGTVAGVYIAVSKALGWVFFDPIAQMHAHAHVGAVGFFVMMVVAVSYKLVPMFALSEVRSTRRASSSIWLLNGGLLASVVAILARSPWKLGAAALAIAGLGLYGTEISLILKHRQRRKLDWPVKQFLCGVTLLVPASVIAAILCWPSLPATTLTTQLENVYGVLAFAGVLSVCILGMLYKIVPFLVWYSSYSRHIGRSKVPSLADLSSRRLQIWGFVAFVPGLIGLCVGALLSRDLVVTGGAVLILASLGFFLTNFGLMLSHLWRPRLGPLRPNVRPS